MSYGMPVNRRDWIDQSLRRAWVRPRSRRSRKMNALNAHQQRRRATECWSRVRKIGKRPWRARRKP